MRFVRLERLNQRRLQCLVGWKEEIEDGDEYG